MTTGPEDTSGDGLDEEFAKMISDDPRIMAEFEADVTVDEELERMAAVIKVAKEFGLEVPDKIIELLAEAKKEGGFIDLDGALNDPKSHNVLERIWVIEVNSYMHSMETGDPYMKELIAELYLTGLEKDENEELWLAVARRFIGPLIIDGTEDDTQRKLGIAAIVREYKAEKAKGLRVSEFRRLMRGYLAELKIKHDDGENLERALYEYVRNTVDNSLFSIDDVLERVDKFAERIGISPEELNAIKAHLVDLYCDTVDSDGE